MKAGTIRLLMAVLYQPAPKHRVTLAYRIWSVTGCERNLTLLDAQRRLDWLFRFFEEAVNLFSTKPQPASGGRCSCVADQHTQYALAMYSRARFGHRSPVMSVYA